MWLILSRSVLVLVLAWAGWMYNPVPSQPLVGVVLGVA